MHICPQTRFPTRKFQKPLITAAHGLHGQEKAGNKKHEQMDANEPHALMIFGCCTIVALVKVLDLKYENDQAELRVDFQVYYQSINH